MSELSEEIKTLATITRHVRIVQKYLILLSQELEKRAMGHDISKLSLDELGGFVEVNRVAREHPYGSEEYKQSLKDNDVINLHFSRNPHHPECWEGGVADMSLIDIIEMVVDWKAASDTYGNTDFMDSLKIQEERFDLTDEQMYLIRLVAKELWLLE